MSAPALAAPPSRVVHDVRRARRRRTRAVSSALAVLLILLTWVDVTWGGYAGELFAHLGDVLGLGGQASFVVGRVRLPATLLGLLVGAAFGISGALFQSVLRNPLASPDILGVSGGASLAAAFAIIVLGLSGAVVGVAAFLGAAAVAAAIYLLAWRDGVAGYRFVLIGVGLAFAINAVINYLLTRSQVTDVRTVLVWTVGSLGTPRWGDVAALALLLAAAIPLVLFAAARLRTLELGDDLAGGLGTRVELARLLVLAVAVALAASGTAFAGPVAFVAFISAPIARRMLPSGGLALIPAALVGACVVVAASVVTTHVITTMEVPVGIITGAIGAPYLLWLLASADRRERT